MKEIYKELIKLCTIFNVIHNILYYYRNFNDHCLTHSEVSFFEDVSLQTYLAQHHGQCQFHSESASLPVH